MPVHELTNPATPSPDIAVKSDGLTLGNVSAGIHGYTAVNMTGAVGSLNFSNSEWLKVTVTGNLTGSFANPPINIPALTVNGRRYTFGIEFTQDATGGRAVPLDTLFSNYGNLDGVASVDPAPDTSAVVLLTAVRTGGATVYSVSLPPAIGGTQIAYGTIPIARIQDATTGQKGVIQIGTGASGAAAGNHTHPIDDWRYFHIFNSDNSALANGDYNVCPDINFAGTITRQTKVYLAGGTTPTATALLKIDTVTVVGTSIAVNTTPGADANATSSNTFVARQSLKVNIASVAGAPTDLFGVVHFVRTGQPTP